MTDRNRNAKGQYTAFQKLIAGRDPMAGVEAPRPSAAGLWAHHDPDTTHAGPLLVDLGQLGAVLLEAEVPARPLALERADRVVHRVQDVELETSPDNPIQPPSKA